jgi:hypothetical protein
MHRLRFAMTVAIIVSPLVSFASTLTIKPTTTLAAQTSNNTSAANGFLAQTNGNLGAGNVSKMDVHSMLYAGANTKVYAHLLLWFGGTNHMNVNYSSTDPAQIKNQVADMISRGINGVIIDWYGPNNAEDQATQLVMAEAQTHPGFTFAIAVDKGAIEWDSCSGCTAQQALIQQLQYVEQTYFSSPAYMKVNGQPVVTNFDVDSSYAIDWSSVSAALSTHPAFLFQNSGGFSHLLSDGSYSWVMPSTSDYGMAYLTNFYKTGELYPQTMTIGTAYKGFNDTLASWGSNRIMAQQCGQTWLQTFAKINQFYNSANQLPALQLVTWNDYEEGSEIESGIDNCVGITASTSGSSLTWNISGNENTIDHYRAYISTDGKALMPLADIAAGTHSLNVCSYTLAARSYKLFVQAIGKPSLANHMSAAVTYSPHCKAATTTSALQVDVSPPLVTVARGQSGNVQVTVQSGLAGAQISLGCSNLPAGVDCTFAPAVVTPDAGAGTAGSVLSISTAGLSDARLREKFKQGNRPLYAFLLNFGIVSIAFAEGIKRKRIVRAYIVGAILALLVFFCSCGGGAINGSSSSAGQTLAGTYNIGVIGNSGGVQSSTTISLTIQ